MHTNQIIKFLADVIKQDKSRVEDLCSTEFSPNPATKHIQFSAHSLILCLLAFVNNTKMQF